MARNRNPFETAVAALNRRAYSLSDLRERLQARGFDESEIEEALGRLIELGELDDESYARLFAADKRDLAGWGPERIAAALRERGVAAELIDRTCAESHQEQVVRAGALLLDRGTVLAEDADRSRALGFLTRRGYPYEIAYDAIRLTGEGH